MPIDKAISYIKKRGNRVTPARKIIVTWINNHGRPFLSKELIEGVTKLGLNVNESTIYRELNFLLEQKMVKALVLEPGTTHYESALIDHHHHLYCIDCGAIQDIGCQSVKNAVQEVEAEALQYGFKVLNHQVEFQGMCKRCSSKN